MKTKFFTLFTASIFALVMFISLASADSSLAITNIVTPTSVANDAGSFTITFDLTNSGEATDLNWSSSSATQGVITSFSFNEDTIEDGSVTPVTLNVVATISFPAGQTGDISGNIIAKGSGDNQEGFSFSVPILPEEITECSVTGDNSGDLEIKIDDINNKGFSGKEFGKDDEWFLLDEIEVDIEVKNNNDDDKIKDIEISWGLYNKDTGEWYIDDEENDFNLNDGDDKTITISFKLDDDIDELAEGDYTLYVWANGKINDDSKTPVCASDFDDGISIVSDESDFVVLYDIQIPEISQCDSQVQITADVWNIGDSDQEDVSVKIYNDELKIYEIVKIGDINEFDSEKLDVLITIPKDAKEKSYNLMFEVLDEDNEVYENDFDEDESKFDRELRIEGNCKVEVNAKASVSAEMLSGGKAGESLVIKVTIENTGDDTTTYTINPASYSTWASSADIDSNTFTLDKGKSKEVLITFNVKKDVSGEKTFSIELLSENQLVTTQPVSVAIEDSSFFSKLSGESNAWLWGIGFLNIVLVVIIILVAVRIVKK